MYNLIANSIDLARSAVAEVLIRLPGNVEDPASADTGTGGPARGADGARLAPGPGAPTLRPC